MGPPGSSGWEIMGIKRIDAERAKELLEHDGEFLYVDVRTPDEYQRGHVPGLGHGQAPAPHRGHPSRPSAVVDFDLAA